MQYYYYYNYTLYIICNRAWKNKLRTAKPENQVELYQTLSVLARELDVSVFQKRLSSFIQLWMPIEPDFVKYFIQYYQNRAGKKYHVHPKFWLPVNHYFKLEKWAKCYRHFNHGDTDTNMYLERCGNVDLCTCTWNNIHWRYSQLPQSIEDCTSKWQSQSQSWLFGSSSWVWEGCFLPLQEC